MVGRGRAALPPMARARARVSLRRKLQVSLWRQLQVSLWRKLQGSLWRKLQVALLARRATRPERARPPRARAEVRHGEPLRLIIIPHSQRRQLLEGVGEGVGQAVPLTQPLGIMHRSQWRQLLGVAEDSQRRQLLEDRQAVPATHLRGGTVWNGAGIDLGIGIRSSSGGFVVEYDMATLQEETTPPNLLLGEPTCPRS